MSEKMHTRIQAMAQSFSMPFDAMVLILLSRSLAFEEDEHQRIKNLLMGEKIKHEFTKDDDKLEIEAPHAQCKELDMKELGYGEEAKKKDDDERVNQFLVELHALFLRHELCLDAGRGIWIFDNKNNGWIPLKLVDDCIPEECETDPTEKEKLRAKAQEYNLTHGLGGCGNEPPPAA